MLGRSWQPAKPPSGRPLLTEGIASRWTTGCRDVHPDTLEARGGLPAAKRWTCPRAVPLGAGVPRGLPRRGGFDAFVCNPPFMGGKKITGNLGTDYRDYLVEHLARGKRGNADLCAYFFLRAEGLLRDRRSVRISGHEHDRSRRYPRGRPRSTDGRRLRHPRAVPSRKWPGTASLEVAHVWIRKGRWAAPFVLDDKPVLGSLRSLPSRVMVTGNPIGLAANAGQVVPGVDRSRHGFRSGARGGAAADRQRPTKRGRTVPLP